MLSKGLKINNFPGNKGMGVIFSDGTKMNYYYFSKSTQGPSIEFINPKITEKFLQTWLKLRF